MGEKVKVLVGEINGTEFGGPVEKMLVAEIVEFTSTSGLTSDEVKGALDELNTNKTNARCTITLTNNSTVTNNQWVGYTELIPSDTTPIVLPWNCKLTEISASFNATSVDGDLVFYKNGILVGNIIKTWNFSNVNNHAYLVSQTDTFVAGDLLRLRWTDNGTNPSDMVICLFFEVLS